MLEMLTTMFTFGNITTENDQTFSDNRDIILSKNLQKFKPINDKMNHLLQNRKLEETEDTCEQILDGTASKKLDIKYQKYIESLQCIKHELAVKIQIIGEKRDFRLHVSLKTPKEDSVLIINFINELEPTMAAFRLFSAAPAKYNSEKLKTLGFDELTYAREY